jgi:outer membrane protein TolC
MSNFRILFILTVAFLCKLCILLPTALAEPFTWEDLNHDLHVNSLALKREKLDVKIAEKDITEGRMAYLPTLQFQANTERLEDLAPAQVNNPNATSIGDTFILNRSITQNSATLGVDYVVLDFGKRKSRVASSTAQRDAESFQINSTVRSLQLEIMPVFAQIWQLQQEGVILKQQLALHTKKLESLKRLEAAGEVGKVPLYEEALQVLSVQQQLDQRQQRLLREYQSLTKYTQRDYSNDAFEFTIDTSTQLSPSALTLTEPSPQELDVSEYPEIKEMQARITQKGEEIKYVKRQRWSPDLSVYGRLIAYGSDGSSLSESIEDFDFRNSRVGLQLRMALSQSYTLKPREEKLKLEQERLELELEERKQNLQLEWSSNETQANSLASMQQTLNDTSQKVGELVKATDRLTKVKVLTPISVLDTQIKQTETQLAQVRADAQRWVITKKREILASAVPSMPATPSPITTPTQPPNSITKPEETK